MELTVGRILAEVNRSLEAAGFPAVSYLEVPHAAPAERRHAAAILHEALLSRGEADGDWDAALSLGDLYECHTCVRHIAQMYAKGIMEAAQEGRFGLRGAVTEGELSRWLARVWDPGRRLPAPSVTVTPPRRITRAEAEALLPRLPRRVLIDLRDEAESAARPFSPEHRSLPFPRLWQNPYQVTENRELPIFLFCRSGYLAVLAAQELSRRGYRQVYAVCPGKTV